MVAPQPEEQDRDRGNQRPKIAFFAETERMPVGRFGAGFDLPNLEQDLVDDIGRGMNGLGKQCRGACGQEPNSFETMMMLLVAIEIRLRLIGTCIPPSLCPQKL